MKSLLAGFALVLIPALLHAQANSRSWVSGVGDDANPASRTAPCLTLTGAIAKTAPGGIIDDIDPGDFQPVTITKAITIDGQAFPMGIAAASTTAIVVNAASTDVVVLRNLTLDGVNNSGVTGVSVLSAAVVVIENCRINGFANGVSFTPSGAGTKLFIKNSTIQNCSVNAVNLAPSAAANVSIVNSHISDSGAGVSTGANCTLEATDTLCSGHGGAGFSTTATGAVMTLTRCVSCDNGIGISSNGVTTITDCAVFNNATSGLLSGKGSTIVSYNNNSVFGNNPNGVPTSTVPLQ